MLIWRDEPKVDYWHITDENWLIICDENGNELLLHNGIFYVYIPNWDWTLSNN